jgi:hypothetical protein
VAAADFEAAVPARIRDDERFQTALEGADTAETLRDAITVHRAEIKDWAAKGLTLLRAVETADEAYEREVVEAFDAFRGAQREEEGNANGIHPA